MLQPLCPRVSFLSPGRGPYAKMGSAPEGTLGQESAGNKCILLASFAWQHLAIQKQLLPSERIMGRGKGKMIKGFLTRRFEWVGVSDSFSSPCLLFLPAPLAHGDVCGEGQAASVSLVASRLSP